MPRKYRGQRAIRITLSTLHIGAGSMVLGAAYFGGPGADYGDWLPLLVFSGGGIVVDDIVRHGWDWLRFVHGWVVLVKFALLLLGLTVSGLLIPALWTALILGSLISHAPGKIRQAALWGPPGPCAERG